ncbi:uncharacterized protein LOC111830672 [Capsella rubella]|uniref:uncharacterized protein LOC111830672 n=1 Tax=Capsella rubella TaxID=81985 RepID=UPI000CD4CF75|nr:uncharacterized protein LOC111830672 [Capsella rubella]
MGWSLANPRSEHGINLMVHLTTITLPTVSIEEDSYEWVVNEHICEGFSASRTWEALRPRSDPVDWHITVWFKGAIPKHACNFWAANLNRLPTQTRDHLMLFCDYVEFIWNAVRIKLNLRTLEFHTWQDLVNWTTSMAGSVPTTLRKLVVQSVVYAIWKQRNSFLHNQTCVLPSVLFKGIDQQIRNTITARNNNKQFKGLMRIWLQ